MKNLKIKEENKTKSRQTDNSYEETWQYREKNKINFEKKTITDLKTKTVHK